VVVQDFDRKGRNIGSLASADGVDWTSLRMRWKL
jgi:hypothetical protein